MIPYVVLQRRCMVSPWSFRIDVYPSRFFMFVWNVSLGFKDRNALQLEDLLYWSKEWKGYKD